jgi:succinoglycan biosynthesis protein ExoA
MSNVNLSSPAITVVLLCRNEVRLIETCLRSILEQVPPPGGFEVLVVDGMSDDGTRPILQRISEQNPGVRVVDNQQRITPCGMNLGIRAAKGKWVAIMGSHNRYAADYLSRCHEIAIETGADNVGGAMFCEGENLMQRAIAAAHHSRFACGGASWHDTSFDGPADTVFGGFYKREVFERIGYFDESLVRNQDDELNLRLSRAGGRIWHSPKIRSWYHPRSSLTALFNQYVQYGYWKVRVIQKHKLPASWRHLVPGAFVLSLGLLLLFSAFSFLLSTFSGGPWSVISAQPWHFCFLFSASSFLSLIGTYALAVLCASVVTAAKTNWNLLPVLPAVFICYHFGYGYGFLRGAWNFVVRRQCPQPGFQTLTR